MKHETIEKITSLANETTGKNVTVEEIEKEILDLEEKMGKELNGYVLNDKTYYQFFPKEVIEKNMKIMKK